MRGIVVGSAFTLAVVAAACAGKPPAAKPVTPAAPPPSPIRTAPAAPVATPPAARQLVRLDNGITTILTRSAPGRQALVQFGIAAGTSMMVPGAAELALQALVDGADASQSRPSLRQAIAALGGTLQVHAGPLTSWIDLRVPGNRWREALVALRLALQSPPWSRAQIERLRDQFVAARTGALLREPAATMAKLLLQGEKSGAGHVLALLDRDAAEVAQFVARAWQPGTALLAIECPTEPATVAAELARTGSVALAAWAPPPPPPGPTTMLDRPFVSGLHWAPGRTEAEKKAPCQVALLTVFAGPAQPGVAEELLLLSSFTFDGAGGRLELLQREHGLADVRWQGSLAQTPDSAGLLLTTTVAPQQVAELWRTVQLARQSLRDIPLNDSELSLASPRVPLLARLPALDDGARLRATTMMSLAGTGFETVDQRLQFLKALGRLDLAPFVKEFLLRPFAMVVVGGEPPPELTDVHRFELLPAGQGEELTPTPPIASPTSPPKAQPWLEQALAAVGGRESLLRLGGWQSEARVLHTDAPEMAEAVTWSAPGTLQRTRTILGQRVETRLDDGQWIERMGTTERALEASAATALRREMQRHPLALLAAFARGELGFRTISQRDVGDRSMVVLEAIGGPYDRLRLLVDTQSHLVRTVEAVATQADGSVVHYEDAWQDYRTVGTLRVPMRRLVTQDDGQNRVETVFTRWTPVFTAK